MNWNENLTEAFDLMAEHYDDRYTENPSMTLMRRRVRELTTTYIKPGHKVLELGSGTGEDALFLAENGCNVLATDCSRKMLDLISGKVSSRQLEDRVKVQLLDINNLDSLLATWEGELNGIFSNFGGLNTIQDLATLDPVISGLLKPGGWLIACVMGRHCLWDWLVDICQLKFNNLGKRRAKDGVVIGVGNYTVTTYFPTPGEFIQAFPGLRPESCKAVGLFLPPPRLTGKLEKLHHLWTFLDIIDQPFAGVTPLHGCGDHFVIAMRKPG